MIAQKGIILVNGGRYIMSMVSSSFNGVEILRIHTMEHFETHNRKR